MSAPLPKPVREKRVPRPLRRSRPAPVRRTPRAKALQKADMLCRRLVQARTTACEAACGQFGATEVHHGIPKSTGPGVRWALLNLAHLCHRCHCYVQTHPDANEALFIKLIGHDGWLYLQEQRKARVRPEDVIPQLEAEAREKGIL